MNQNNFKRMLNDRFGMFVHYGIYSEMGGSFNGEEWSGIGEWIQRRLEIPNAEYEAFGRKHFKPRADFAQNLVSQAKAAGVKYIVLTSKHHDGFCLFKSDYSDYSTYGFFGRDLCKELADECRKQGLELGLYYSHTLDWHEKDAGGNFQAETMLETDNRNFWDFPDNNIDFDKYLYEKCFPQVRELLTNYGDLKLIWFDYPHDITRAQSEELRALVKELQPNCQINSRIGHDCCDYNSLGDNALPLAPTGVNTECLITLNDTWGYKKNDNNWKSHEDILGILCRCLSADATLLLNVGPMGDGSLTPETEDILKMLGQWTARNHEAVYDGVLGNPTPSVYPWGYISQKGNDLFLYVQDNAAKNISFYLGSNNAIRSVSLIGAENEVAYTFENGILSINTAETAFLFPVYKVTFKSAPCFDQTPTQCGDVISLSVMWASMVSKGHENEAPKKLYYEPNAYLATYGKPAGLCLNCYCVTSFWTNNDEILCWDMRFTQAGTYAAMLAHPTHYDLQGEETDPKTTFNLTVGAQTNAVDMENEAERYWISKTKDGNARIARSGGTFTIPAPGVYRVLLERTNDAPNTSIDKIEFTKIN